MRAERQGRNTDRVGYSVPASSTNGKGGEREGQSQQVQAANSRQGDQLERELARH